MQILIKNPWLISRDMGTTPKKVNLVIRDGIIVEITERDIPPSEQFDKIIDAEGKFVMPGLVNSHMHSYASFVKATTENIPLETWMLHIMAQGRSMEPEDLYWNALLGAAEMIKSGTTSCMDHLAQGFAGLDAVMRAYDDIGIRATLAPMISDKTYFETLPVDQTLVPPELKSGSRQSIHALLETTTALLRKWQGRGDRLGVAFGPSGPQRCTDDLLRECMKLATEYDTVWHSHVLESKAQEETGHFLYGKPMVQHLDEIGCLNERTSLVHAVWLTREEAKRASARGAVVVHNPASNLILGSGIAPVNMYRELGVAVALGTDGANCGGNLNMLEVIKLAAMLHKFSNPNPQDWITAGEALSMATINGARVTLQDQAIGLLEPGRRADLVILNPLKSPALQPVQNPLWQLVYGESGTAVECVIIQGRVVLEDGKLTMIDEDVLYQEANIRAAQVVERSMSFSAEIEAQSDFIKRHLRG